MFIAFIISRKTFRLTGEMIKPGINSGNILTAPLQIWGNI